MTRHDHLPTTTDDANDAETDLETGTIIEGAAGAGVRTEIGRTETTIETRSHHGGDTVVEVGMGTGATNGKVSDPVFAWSPLKWLFTDGNVRALKSVRLVRLRRSAPKPKKRLAKSQN